MQTDKATAAKGVAKLESIGYLMRVQDSHDGRIRRLYLTDEGNAVIPSVKTALRRVTDISSKNLETDELELLFSLLDRVETAVTDYVTNTKGDHTSP